MYKELFRKVLSLLIIGFTLFSASCSSEALQNETLTSHLSYDETAESTDEITTSCDIYALGRIINELFTKQNPSGEAFLTIAEKNPLLLPLD